MDTTLDALVRATFESQWRPPGYVCPNPQRYPWMWLWDSCFHAVVWAQLGDGARAVAELATALAHRDGETGFVAHMAYHGAPASVRVDAARFWGTDPDASVVVSSITQPPMFGHALAELHRRGVAVPDELIPGACAGLWFLLRDRRRHRSGLIELVHPWESGCDDSARWDTMCETSGAWRADSWRVRKGELLGGIERTASGAPVANDSFAVAGIGFNALVAFNAVELGSLIGDVAMVEAGAALARDIAPRWDPTIRTWADAGPTAERSGRARTLDAMLALLVCPRDDGFDDLVDASAYGAPFGPRGAHVGEPSYDPITYWRGPAWPQLSYLLWLAASRAGRGDVADAIAAATVGAAEATGLAEHWHPERGLGGGAVPQAWTGLTLAMR